VERVPRRQEEGEEIVTFKPGDRVVNAISPSCVGTVVARAAREDFVRVHFPGHGESFPLPVAQLEKADHQ